MALTNKQRQDRYRKKLREENPDEYKWRSRRIAARAEERKRDNPAYYLWRLARDRAMDKGLKFSIKPEDVVIPDNCPILGIPLKRGGGMNPNSPTIDRIDNAKGYTKKNIVVISYRANTLKGDATHEELYLISRFYELEYYRR